MIGYRGYLGSRPPFGCERTPQHVQNIVLRDYARRKGLRYLMGAIEYTMPGCFQMLESVLDELSNLNGVVAYSLFMLPSDDNHRCRIYRQFLDTGKALHFALEDLALAAEDDRYRLETLWQVQKLMQSIDQVDL